MHNSWGLFSNSSQTSNDLKLQVYSYTTTDCTGDALISTSVGINCGTLTDNWHFILDEDIWSQDDNKSKTQSVKNIRECDTANNYEHPRCWLNCYIIMWLI